MTSNDNERMAIEAEMWLEEESVKYRNRGFLAQSRRAADALSVLRTQRKKLEDIEALEEAVLQRFGGCRHVLKLEEDDGGDDIEDPGEEAYRDHTNPY